MSWQPEDPRGWGGWAPWDPRWGPHRAGWGYRRPLYDNQLGWRLPTGGLPGPGQTGLGIVLLLFVLGPPTILAWLAGQALLRATGLRWWKLALAAVAAIAVVVAIQGGPGPALAHHFTGYVQWARQYGAPELHLPARGRSCGRSSPSPSRSACSRPRSTWPAAGKRSTPPRSARPSGRRASA
jgi:hypothetical protein